MAGAGSAWPQSRPLPDTPSREAIADLQRQIDERYATLEKDTTFDEVTRAGGLSRLDEGRTFLTRAVADIEATEAIAQQRAAAPELQAAAEAALTAPAESASSESPAQQGPSDLRIAADAAATTAKEAQRSRIELEERRSALRARRPLIGPELAAARAALTAVRDRQLEIRIASETRPGTRTSLLRALAEEQALLARIAFLEEQRAGIDVRERLLDTRIEVARRKAGDEQAKAGRLREAYDQRQRTELLGAAESPSADRAASDPRVRALTEANAALLAAHPSDRTVAQLATARAELESIEAELADLAAESEYVERTLAAVGRSYAAEQVIADALRELPESVDHDTAIRKRSKRIEEVLVDVTGLSRERLRFERQLDGAAAATTAAQSISSDEYASAAAVRSLSVARLELLQTTIRELEEYVGVLTETQARERTLTERLDHYETGLRSRQAWVPNLKPVNASDARGAVRGLATLANMELWRGLAAAFTGWIRVEPLRVGLAVLGVILSFAVAARVGRAAPVIARRSATGVVTLRFAQRLLPALISAGALAFGVWLAGWLIGSAPDAPTGATALGRGLQRIAVGVFLIVTVRLLYAVDGPLLRRLPNWSELAATVRRANARLAWALVGFVVSILLFEASLAGIGVHGDLAARLCLIVAISIIVWALHAALAGGVTLLRPADSPVAADRLRRRVWTGIFAVTLFLLLVAAVTNGFVLATLLVSRAVLFTLAITVIYRAVAVLLIEAPPVAAAEPLSDVDALMRDRNHLVRLALLLGLVLALFWVWGEGFQALQYLREITLWTTESAEGIESVTVANLLTFMAALTGTLIAFWALPILAGTRSLDPSRPDIGTRYATITLIRYVVLIVGAIGAFSLLNIGWSKLQWMAAGLSVGLGFGLQESVANFIAGLMLLTEGQIRVGDLITVGDKTGLVSRIQMRATTVRDFDGREVILPNKGLVTTEVTNWTLSDTHRRLQIVVGVAYGSDTDLIEKLMLEVAQSVDWLLPDPAPRVVFEQFGDHALHFRLYVWIAAGQRVLDTIHALHCGLERAFREHGIEIAFPQQDVHLDATKPLSVRVVTEPAATPGPVAPQS